VPQPVLSEQWQTPSLPHVSFAGQSALLTHEPQKPPPGPVPLLQPMVA
jgi:hypothetical protein